MAKKRVVVIIPTSINVITAVNDALITRARNGETAEVELPSLRRRALMVVQEKGVLTVQQDAPFDETNFSR